MNPIDPKEVRYIKLGAGGKWVRVSLDRGEIHFSHRTVPHDLCIQGDWDAVVQHRVDRGRSPAKAKDGMREIRDFYTLGANCLWITFAEGHLWWAFAEPEVVWLGAEENGHGARMRKTVDGWHKANIKGEPLRTNQLSTKLTQVAAYRQTICRVKEVDYLVRRINDVDEPVVARARKARQVVVTVASEMIAGLHWADFETLVDLIFARSGWQRISRVGGSQKDVDLILEQPTTGEKACVQVKSKAGQAVLDNYVDRFRRRGVNERWFFVCHSPKGTLSADGDARLHVWAGDRLADTAVRAGLFDWLTERTA
ncbi:MAG: restriction endonuclease [Proteobacteria bacterium]|nr:restriction endonuclease [Pseudomonadota bacterium]